MRRAGVCWASNVDEWRAVSVAGPEGATGRAVYGRRRPAWNPAICAAWLLTVGFVVAGIALSLPAGGFDAFTLLTGLVGSVAAVSLATTGAVLASRLPRNPIGWLLFVSGALLGFGDLASSPLPANLPLATWIAWLGNLTWAPAIIGLGILLPLVFPTGHLPSRRWRVMVVIALVALVLADLQGAFSPYSPGSAPPGVENPLALGGLAATLLGAAGAAATVSAVIFFPVVAVSLVMRFRRSSGVERAQLRWLAAALVLIGPSLGVGIAAGSAPGGALIVVSNIAWLLAVLGLALLPVAIGVAVLRYRLYDLDLLLNRTAVYGSVSVLLVLGFLVGNFGLQSIVQSLTHQSSELLSEGLAMGVGILFVPLRRRIRPVVDRVLPGRAVLALLFTDIVGSTERIVDIGDQRWRSLLGQYLAAVRQEVARHGGHEVNTAGDALFATFDHPLDAVDAATGIRAAVEELGLETRTGVHMGEVEMRGEQVSGLSVHTAARVMAAASAGEILVSAAVREALAAEHLRLHDRGRHSLKGVPGEWQLWAVDQPSAGSEGARASTPLPPH